MSPKSETVLNVEGMSCHSCVSHVDKALREIDGVFSVQVRLRDGIVTVQHDPQAASVINLIEALRDAGYEATSRAVA